MTDLRKAAEMALEFVDWLCGDDHSVKPKNKALDVREALRQALAQPEQYDQTALELCNVCGWKAVIPDEGCLVCARKNQGPVAWITDGGKGDLGWRKTTEKDIPLYTAPPKREWVGLTDEEIDGLWKMAQMFRAHKHFYLLVEAKLKEKNT